VGPKAHAKYLKPTHMHGNNVGKRPALGWLMQSQGCMAWTGGGYLAWARPRYTHKRWRLIKYNKVCVSQTHVEVVEACGG